MRFCDKLEKAINPLRKLDLKEKIQMRDIVEYVDSNIDVVINSGWVGRSAGQIIEMNAVGKSMHCDDRVLIKCIWRRR